MKVYFDGATKRCGCDVKNVSVDLPEDYTMNQLVQAVWNRGFKAFKLETMKRYYYITKDNFPRQ